MSSDFSQIGLRPRRLNIRRYFARFCRIIVKKTSAITSVLSRAVPKTSGNFWDTFHLSSNVFLFEQPFLILSNFLQFQDRRISESCSKAIQTFSSISRTSPKINEICRRFPRMPRRFVNFRIIQYLHDCSK